MKILIHLKSGAVRSLKTWKGILIIWVSTLFLISLLALPVKSGFKSMLGSSMVTELLSDTVNLDVISDLQQEIGAILPVLGIGFLLVCFFGLLLNTFFAGGLFTLLSSKNSTRSASIFFSGAASNFWSYLVISVIVTVILIFSGFIIAGIPMIFVSGFVPDTPEPGVTGNAIRIALLVMALLLPLILLVADYARAWQADHHEKKPFKAIGFGFSRTFRSFFLSYPLMLTIILVQAGYGVLVVSKLMLAKPSTGGEVFLFFVISQLLFLIKIWMRVWRYGSITSASEDELTAKTYFQDLSVPVAEPQPEIKVVS